MYYLLTTVILFQFDRMLYVVENAQSSHFSRLKGILNVLGHTDLADKIEHVKFGKIRGLSTRKGTAAFLSDILDEAVAKMREQQADSANTRAEAGPAATDILATTAVAINDLRSKRAEDYDFSWERALQSTGDRSGVRLQYNHSRLASLIDNNGAKVLGDQTVIDLVNGIITDIPQ